MAQASRSSPRPGNRQRRKEAPAITRIERRGESDDEVRGNIPPELVALFERVKRGIKASPRMSRTEAFLHYAEFNPDEVLAAISDKTDELVRQLEEQHREAQRVARRTVRRPPDALHAGAAGRGAVLAPRPRAVCAVVGG